ncbi:hypothetical protein [Methanosarcina siciliae]|nr:hypothetical protein [Methanosarcina siciliae]
MSEKNTEVGEELCNCDVCRKWRDKENMITGIFTMLKDAYEKVVEFYPELAGDFNQLRCQPMSTFFGMMVLKGVAESGKDHTVARIEKTLSEKLAEIFS